MAADVATAPAPPVWDTLRKARQIVSDRGWVAGDYVARDGCLCAATALVVAVGAPEHRTWNGDPPRAAISAARALARYVGSRRTDLVTHDDDSGWLEVITVWNDEDAQTAGQVLAALADAADHYERTAAP